MDVLIKAKMMLDSLKETDRKLKHIQDQIDLKPTDFDKIEYLFGQEFNTALQMSSTFEALMMVLDNLDEDHTSVVKMKQQAKGIIGGYYDVK